MADRLLKSDELSAALAAVRRAALFTEHIRRSVPGHGARAKEDRSPVTLADYGAQAVILSALARDFPGDGLVAEETAADLRAAGQDSLRKQLASTMAELSLPLDERACLEAIDLGHGLGGPSGRFWTLDPVDGTKGFLRNDQYAIALALVEDGVLRLGVLACPNYPVDRGQPDGPRGLLFCAVAGAGAHALPLHDEIHRTPLRPRDPETPADLVLCESVESGHSAHDDSARVAARLGLHRPPVRMDSQAKYAALARGDASLYLRLPTRAGYQEKIWDHATGALLVREAGGTVTDTAGRPLDFSRGRTLSANTGIAASLGGHHPAVLAALAAAN